MKDKKIKIVHITTVHQRYDVRILLKECLSLAKNNWVYLLVADGKGNEFFSNSVSIIDVGCPKNRWDRISSFRGKAYKMALQLEADIYHLHDPELLSIGLKLKKSGKKVIYDAHEDVPKDILTKHYIPFFLRLPMSFVAKIYEKKISKKIDGVIAATPFINEKFLGYGVKSVDINNYPKLDEFLDIGINWEAKKDNVCYVGGLAKVRGVQEIVDAMSFSTTNSKLYLAGTFAEAELEKRVKASMGWNKVKELGWLNRDEIVKTLYFSKAGLVTLHPTVTYLNSLPVKMFEYMGAGIPVIASNFPLWKEIVEKNQCGVCVDPLDLKEIANAIDYLIRNPSVAEEMGKNGRNLVMQKYNWANEEKKLLKFYQALI